MADQFSFDVVSKVDMQEMKNALDQTIKEIQQRFDFKDSKTELTLKEKEHELVVISDDEYKLKAVLDILKNKCVKRAVSLKAPNYGKVEQALGGTVRQSIAIQSGIVDEKLRTIVKGILDAKFKVQPHIQGDQIHVQSKDELQAVITFLTQEDFGIDIQFENYR